MHFTCSIKILILNDLSLKTESTLTQYILFYDNLVSAKSLNQTILIIFQPRKQHQPNEQSYNFDESSSWRRWQALILTSFNSEPLNTSLNKMDNTHEP